MSPPARLWNHHNHCFPTPSHRPVLEFRGIALGDAYAIGRVRGPPPGQHRIAAKAIAAATDDNLHLGFLRFIIGRWGGSGFLVPFALLSLLSDSRLASGSMRPQQRTEDAL